MVALGAMVGLLVLVGGQPAEAGLDAARVVPAVDVGQGVLGLSAGGERGARPVHELDLDGGPQVLGQGVVEAVAGAAGRGCDPGVDEALGEPQRGVLGALVAVKDQLPGAHLARAQRVVIAASTSTVVARGSVAQPTMRLAKALAFPRARWPATA